MVYFSYVFKKIVNGKPQKTWTSTPKNIYLCDIAEKKKKEKKNTKWEYIISLKYFI